VNTDGTFRHGFVAGQDSLNDGTNDPMTESGTYTITLEYFPPGGGTETTELTFEYDATTDAEESEAVAGPTTTFQSTVDGFRVQVPSGWVVDDLDNTSPSAQAAERTQRFAYLARLCPQSDALPAIGGNYTCTTSTEQSTLVTVTRFAELQTRPEFVDVVRQNRTITTSDLFALFIQLLENNLGAYDFGVENDTDTTVNIIDSRTNQTVGTASAKYVEYTYRVSDQFGGVIEYSDFNLIVLSNDSNTGYVVIPTLPITTITEEEELQPLPEQIQVLDSFELLTPTTPSLRPQGQPQQGQLVQSAGGLTARLNANNFTTGDTITVNGTVAERDGYS
jgi:hypothetical protein